MLDSGHFFWTVQLICEHLKAFPGPAPASFSYLGDALMQDGPGLSLLPALIFLAIGKVPVSSDWLVVAITMCLYQALASTFVYLIVFKILKSPGWAMTAGVLWALYPPAILNTDRFLTEGLAHMLLVAATWLLLESTEASESRMKFSVVALFSGLLQGLLLLTKPPLLFCCLLINAFSWSRFPSARKRLIFAISLVAGMVIVLTPWALTAKATTGHLHVIPKRCAVHNLAKGLNYEVDAWQGFPVPDLTILYSNWFGFESGTEELLAVGRAIISARPLESLYLAARKFVRLFSLPWNDFNSMVLFLSPSVQVLLHRAIVLFSFFGMAFFLFSREKRDNLRTVSKFFVSGVVVVLLALVGHLAYMPFEAMPRYWFTGMPYMVMFAVLGAYWIRESHSKKLLIALSTGVFFVVLSMVDMTPLLVQLVGSVELAMAFEFAFKAVLIVLIIGISLFPSIRIWKESPKILAVPPFLLMTVCVLLLWVGIFQKRMTKEWSCRVEPGCAVSRSVKVRGSDKSPGAAYLVVDCDREIEKAKILLNGEPVKFESYPVYSTSAEQFEVCNYVRFFANTRGQQFEDMRFWRIIPIAPSLIKMGEINTITIESGPKPLTIYGDYEPEGQPRRYPPSFLGFSPNKFVHDPFAADGRLMDPVGLKVIEGSSSFFDGNSKNNSDLSPSLGCQTGEYRIFLALDSHINNMMESAAPATNREIWKHGLGQDAFDLSMKHGAGEIRMNKSILRFAKSNSTKVSIPAEVSRAIKANTSVKVRLSGEIKDERSTGLYSSIAVFIEGTKHNFVLPASSYGIESGDQWRNFEISNVIPVHPLLEDMKSISISIFPGPWEMVAAYGCPRNAPDALFRNLVLEVEHAEAPQIKDFRALDIY